MEKSKTLSEQAGVFRDLLNGEKIAEIDFDSLAALLSEVAQVSENHATRQNDLAALRQDYEGRIAGMVKAMAAVDRSGRSYDEALRSLDEIPALSGEELAARYRRVAARFRDMFPTTFGHSPFTVRTKASDMSVYK